MNANVNALTNQGYNECLCFFYRFIYVKIEKNRFFSFLVNNIDKL